MSLTYDDNGITSMSLSYEMELPRGASYWAVFISSQIIGVLQMPYVGIGPAERTLNLLAYNLKREQAVTITTDIEVQVCMRFDSTLYVYNDILGFVIGRPLRDMGH